MARNGEKGKLGGGDAEKRRRGVTRVGQRQKEREMERGREW